MEKIKLKKKKKSSKSVRSIIILSLQFQNTKSSGNRKKCFDSETNFFLPYSKIVIIEYTRKKRNMKSSIYEPSAN